MRFIDAHLHTDMVEDKQLQKLVMMGMEAAVVPSPHMFLGQRDADAVELLWERLPTSLTRRGSSTCSCRPTEWAGMLQPAARTLGSPRRPI